jgi:protein TonB
LAGAAQGPSFANGPLAAGGGGGTRGHGIGTGHGTEGANATGDARARLLSSYLASVRQRVAQHREYPYLARRANIEGTVCLRVVVAASGRVLGVTPTCGTHQPPLLDAALASVSNAAPFPPLPAVLGQRLTVDVPVVFELDPM